MDTSPEQQTQLCRLHDFMTEVLSSQRTIRPHSLFLLIERWLKQFNLSSQIDSSEVLVEAYMRTRSKLLNGTHIERFPAWFNSVSYKIIQEYSRKEKYKRLLDQRLIKHEQHYAENIINSNIEQPNVDELLKSLESLKEEDLEVLHLRIVQGLSWKEVKEQWLTNKGEDISEAALRKKGERALSRLRKVFASTYPPMPSHGKG